MVIAKTIPLQSAPQDAHSMGRLYRSRQHPRICRIANGLCAGCEETPVGETVELMRHDGRSVLTRGICTHCHCDRDGTQMIIRERRQNHPDRYIHVSMHAHEIMTAVRTCHDVGFIPTKLQYVYPPGVQINICSSPSA